MYITIPLVISSGAVSQFSKYQSRAHKYNYLNVYFSCDKLFSRLLLSYQWCGDEFRVLIVAMLCHMVY